MPGSIPKLDEIGPQLEGRGLQSLREEVGQRLGRRNSSFPGTNKHLFHTLEVRLVVRFYQEFSTLLQNGVESS